jgi:hypothetical protein
MAWENRERGGPYYTRSRREGGLVVREYIGSGAFAELVAEADETKRLERRRLREQECEDLEHLEALTAPLHELDEGAEILARAVLVAGGYHRHKGEWRLRRGRRG